MASTPEDKSSPGTDVCDVGLLTVIPGEYYKMMRPVEEKMIARLLAIQRNEAMPESNNLVLPTQLLHFLLQCH